MDILYRIRAVLINMQAIGAVGVARGDDFREEVGVVDLWVEGAAEDDEVGGDVVGDVIGDVAAVVVGEGGEEVIFGRVGGGDDD